MTINDNKQIIAPEKHLERKNPILDLWKQFKSLLYGIIERDPKTATLGLMDFLARTLRGAPIAHFSRVTDHLLVSGQYGKRGWRRLQEEGVTAVVNLRDEYDDRAAGIAPKTYLYLPIIDNTPPTMEQLKKGADFISKEIDAGGKVYIHCAAGVGRAPTMAAAYLVQTGMPPHAAWQTIRNVRPFIRPTPAQVAQIEAFAAQSQAKAQT